jgi:hypothetical protein
MKVRVVRDRGRIICCLNVENQRQVMEQLGKTEQSRSESVSVKREVCDTLGERGVGGWLLASSCASVGDDSEQNDAGQVTER